MAKLINVIDSSGFYLHPEIITDNISITENMIETPCPCGFYRPKWDGTQWVEGMSQAEIDALLASALVSRSLEELAEDVQTAMLAIMYLSIE